MEEFLGTIKAFGFNFSPRGWMFCNGQLLSISQNSALFALLGTIYGGDGQNTFALPDLRGRTIIHPGTGPGLSPIVVGQTGGTENITLTQNNLPAHTHALATGQVAVTTVINALTGGTVTNDCDNGTNSFASGGNAANAYSEPVTPPTTSQIGGVTSTISGTTSSAGGSQPFSLRNPYLGIYMSICVEGIFPSRN
jgi:microcystin-dependent protein